MFFEEKKTPLLGKEAQKRDKAGFRTRLKASPARHPKEKPKNLPKSNKIDLNSFYA